MVPSGRSCPFDVQLWLGTASGKYGFYGYSASSVNSISRASAVLVSTLRGVSCVTSGSPRVINIDHLPQSFSRLGHVSMCDTFSTTIEPECFTHTPTRSISMTSFTAPYFPCVLLTNAFGTSTNRALDALSCRPASVGSVLSTRGGSGEVSQVDILISSVWQK